MRGEGNSTRTKQHKGGKEKEMFILKLNMKSQCKLLRIFLHHLPFLNFSFYWIIEGKNLIRIHLNEVYKKY